MSAAEAGVNQAVIPQLDLLVVGTGRSGTTFTAESLRRSGIAIDHEAVFTELGPRDPGDSQGDVSWMAVPYLDRFQGAVLHQVREPLAVIDSLLDLGLFAGDFSDEIHRPWRRFLEANFTLSGDALLDVMRFYVQWNERCEPFADLRIRIEDQAHLISGFIDRLYPGKGLLVEAQISRVSMTINSREERRVSRMRSQGLTWEELPGGGDRDALMAMAGRYGYGPLPA